MPPLPPQLINYIGAAVVFLFCLIVVTGIQEWTKRIFRNGSGDRRGGDSQLFGKIVQVETALIEHLRLCNEHQEKTNHILQTMIEDSQERHLVTRNELYDIKRSIQNAR